MKWLLILSLLISLTACQSETYKKAYAEAIGSGKAKAYAEAIVSGQDEALLQDG